MREIRISSAHSTGDRGGPRPEGEVFVFDDETDAALVQRWQRGDLTSRIPRVSRIPLPSSPALSERRSGTLL